MAKRTMPYGYRMELGNPCIVEDEAEIVRMIFASYAKGSSYETLAAWLNDKGCPYCPDKRWNKNMVARILQDKRYLGAEEYPPIVEADSHERRTPSNKGWTPGAAPTVCHRR